MTSKAEDAFRTIGEMAEELGVKPHILRYWEEQFETLAPLKRAGGRRHYRPEDAALLRQIQSLLQDKGFTIKGARRFLETDQKPDSAAAEYPRIAPAKSPAFDGRALDALRLVRNRLAAALDSS